MLKRIGHKILLVVGVVVTIGLLVLVWFYTRSQEDSLLEQNQRTMLRLTESVSQSLQTVMLAGYADVAQTFADNLKKVPEVIDFRILRTNGHEAFRDNTTIESVNRRRGEEAFLPRETEKVVPVLEPTRAELLRAVNSGEIVAFYETGTRGQRYLTFIAPIQNQKDCYRCHGRDHPVRGLIKLTTDLSPVEENIRITRMRSFGILVVAIIGIMLLTGFMIRRSVIRPIDTVTQAMLRAARGDLTQQVPVFGKDELSTMAGSFNAMIKQLLHTYTGLQNEQDKLTTIILSAREGIVVTDATGAVVLANPAAEQLLGKSMARIADEGFLNLIGDPEQVASWIEREDSAAHIVQYKDRTLSIHASTIRTADGSPIGSASLLRDVTEEKKLEEKLRRLSTTDGLTGLYNRRHLDAQLDNEFGRAQRYTLPLAILMFDVDHFKRFNDEHGHEMGDKVLEAIAQAMRDALRRVDIPCRYGGEEFMAILPNTDAQNAMLVAERLRARIEAMRVEGLQVTVSIGVAEFPTLRCEEATDMITAADAALYEAKRGGRNCVRLATNR